jgi:hypothetical protein
MLRNAIAVLAIVLVLGSSGLSTSAFARGAGYGGGDGFHSDHFGGGFGDTPGDSRGGYGNSPAVCVADSAVTGAVMPGATGAPIMAYDSPDLN